MTHSGVLIEVDTVHIIAPDGSRIYIYTLIDLFSRLAYAEVTEKIGAEASVRFVRRAQRASSFRFEMIQTDHGSEFSTCFTHNLWQSGMSHRHSRVRQSNDNAHIERFNRTLQEECLDGLPDDVETINCGLKKYLQYYNYKRLHMGISLQVPNQLILMAK